MPLSLAAPEDICNAALGRLGWKFRIGSLWDGATATKAALDIYGQTRDELLRSKDWGFAERIVSLTLLKTAPPGGYTPVTPWTAAYPILPWRYEYLYPGDTLKVRSIRAQPILIPPFAPRPKVFRVANDPTLTPPAQVILTDVVNAILVYTGQVTDPLAMEPMFLEELVASLARRLAPVVANLDAAKVEAGDEAAAMQAAESKEG
jgi:hypothetical protein